VSRAARSDVTYAFLGVHIALRVGRALWLGDPLTIPLHQVQNEALVLFAFFMISDPKTTPDTRLGRLLFAGFVALGAWYGQFVWYRGEAVLWSLAGCALTVPLLDGLLPGPRYAWPQAGVASPRAARRHAEDALVPCARTRVSVHRELESSGG
jgi:Na+-translocating ferredoxin:NAD+ oxidoreductase RnfD subunit